jgi:hypothetical protein
MQTQLPLQHLPPDIKDMFTRIYTDIFNLYNKTEVSDPTAMGNTNGEIAGLTFSATPTQAECEALRDKCEELADDVRNIHSTLSGLIDTLQDRDLI